MGAEGLARPHGVALLGLLLSSCKPGCDAADTRVDRKQQSGSGSTLAGPALTGYPLQLGLRLGRYRTVLAGTSYRDTVLHPQGWAWERLQRRLSRLPSQHQLTVCFLPGPPCPQPLLSVRCDHSDPARCSLTDGLGPGALSSSCPLAAVHGTVASHLVTPAW